jgi:hypothetical protein
MLNYNIILLALSLAFCQVEVLHFGSIKPFNCIKCMTGHYALIIGCIMYGWHGLVYLPVGVFAGALFDRIKMRWL